VYEEAAWLLDTSVGGFAVEKYTSYVVAPSALHASVGEMVALSSVSVGLGALGVAGAAARNDHTGPSVRSPAAFFATICQ
jgi:hypothetical protein